MARTSHLTGLTLCLALAAPASPQGALHDCPGFPDGAAGSKQANEFYAERVAQILSAARRGDRDALKTVIAPSFTYSMKQSDVIHVGRREDAVQGALELARLLGAKRYELTSEWEMFFHVPETCEWSVEMQFTVAEDAVSRPMDEPVRTRVTFAFKDGLLASANGRWLFYAVRDIP